MSPVPAAFMSYVRRDDQHEDSRLTQFRERLSGEVGLQTGEEFVIFQDNKHIAWGEQWRQRIEESVDAATFLIPMLTPGFFKSQYCRAELERFLEREEQLGRHDRSTTSTARSSAMRLSGTLTRWQKSSPPDNVPTGGSSGSSHSPLRRSER